MFLPFEDLAHAVRARTGNAAVRAAEAEASSKRACPACNGTMSSCQLVLDGISPPPGLEERGAHSLWLGGFHRCRGDGLWCEPGALVGLRAVLWLLERREAGSRIPLGCRIGLGTCGSCRGLFVQGAGIKTAILMDGEAGLPPYACELEVFRRCEEHYDWEPLEDVGSLLVVAMPPGAAGAWLAGALVPDRS